ncbi:MAG: chorismate mutase [Dehalococcoidia bacterium]|jgi:chorismate mutase|uniref:Chorismate mutase n=1 Tax=marine metagenome TaxID=408172 RepID=A0A382DM79_9ZZZZ|nr:chorismate mutase [Chloroflexota bacterium]MBV46002.1 chorismate mutase [Dehalococcoidia bacterium]MCH2312407.1 chorismate mutase [SAR202 cluster bacterium]MCS5648068.1 chorismate mutase [Dehalococcoidia bacterium]MEC7913052.1 chorismate mutase [Chloroflexota bacterium]|tara:strand:- start:13212 stop:13583 length:372 start_codon:yes stop_codon:yes gene_type:complete
MSEVRAIRGATTSPSNSSEEILAATTEMLDLITKENSLKVDDIISAFFTTTQDLNAEFPPVAARKMGWVNVALMCSHEMKVPGALQKCIRVMVHVNTDKNPSDIVNIYLRDAVNLRKRGFENG